MQRFSYTDPAIDYALTNNVHIAFLDIEMYEVNGIDIAKKLIEIHPDINIIFSTGYKEYMEEAFQGEYMTQYSWAESRIAALEEIKCSK